MRFGLRRDSISIRVGLAALAVVAAFAPMILGHTYGQTAQQSPKLSFDVASVHEWGSGEGPVGAFSPGVQFSPGRVHGVCANLASLLFNAYQLTGSEPVEGMPKWGRASCGAPDSRETFAIEATMPAATTMAQARQMMQTLLAERFKLAVHWENRQLPVYELKVIPGRLKLKPSDPDKDPPNAPGSIGCPVDDPHCGNYCCGSSTMTALTGSLTGQLGRPVMDKTGLTGTYYLGFLKWAGDGSNSSLPSVFAMMREELGLELKPEVGPVPVLVVDHAEKPTEN